MCAQQFQGVFSSNLGLHCAPVQLEVTQLFYCATQRCRYEPQTHYKMQIWGKKGRCFSNSSRNIAKDCLRSHCGSPWTFLWTSCLYLNKKVLLLRTGPWHSTDSRLANVQTRTQCTMSQTITSLDPISSIRQNIRSPTRKNTAYNLIILWWPYLIVYLSSYCQIYALLL